ncbi:MAG: tetratricopeptide repeat protein [Ktedonobacteraceae bacterium]
MSRGVMLRKKEQPMAARGKQIPNTILRRLREERGWSLQRVADELRLLAEVEDENRIPGVNANMVGVWERGWKRPSPFYQALFCQLYQRPASQLGFVCEEIAPPAPPAEMHQAMPAPTHAIKTLPQLALAHEQTCAIDLLCHPTDSVPEHQAGAWLTLGASGLSQLFHEGWTPGEILASLQVVLQGMQAMPSFTRRQLLQLGGAAVMSSIPVPVGERVSEEERMQLTSALGESIGAGWKLFHTAGNAQVLAIGQALLCLLKQYHSELPPAMQPLLYSPVYRLIGAALHYQDRYSEALKAHNQAYFTALEGADIWNMAQSRIWQAYALKEQKQYGEALQVLEIALRLVSSQNSIECIRTTAHIYASSAEIAAQMNDGEDTRRRLDASEALLGYFSGCHEEFDRASWYGTAGVCSIYLRKHEAATRQLQKTLESLPPQLTFRRVITLIPLIMAYANVRERDASLAMAEEAIPLINTINASGINRQFVEYTTCALTGAFPCDSKVHEFVDNMQHQLLLPVIPV